MASADPATDVLTDFVHGVALELGAQDPLPGASLVEFRSGRYAFDGVAAASVDSIVSRGGLEHAFDTIETLEACRDALRDGGCIAVVIADGANPDTWSDAPHAFTIESLGRTLTRLGGFEVVRTAELTGEGAWLLVAERRTARDIRTVLGIHGPALADAAQRDPTQRSELLFQVGTIMLRAGEAPIARRCYEVLQASEPDNSECVFGLGMCHALERSWSTAVTWLQRAVELDASNAEAQRWLGFARLELDSDAHGLGPQAAISDR